MAVSRLGLPILGTGSADQTAKVGYLIECSKYIKSNLYLIVIITLKVWGMHSGSCLLEYQVHFDLIYLCFGLIQISSSLKFKPA